MPEMTERLEELQASGETIGLLAANAELFNAAAAAFRADDAERFQDALGRAGLLDRCHWICRWFCSKHCVFICHKLAGRNDAEPVLDIDEWRAFAEFTGKLAHDPETLLTLLDIVAAEDDKAYQEYVTAAADPALRPPVVPLAVRSSLSRGVQADVPADARADQGRIHPGRPLRRRAARFSPRPA